jgi:hypothetical protein
MYPLSLGRLAARRGDSSYTLGDLRPDLGACGVGVNTLFLPSCMP